MSGNGGKGVGIIGGDAQMRVNRPGDKKLFRKRWMMGRPAGTLFRRELARDIARTVAEDANTAYYVQEYNAGNFSSREDYIDYLAERVELIMYAKGIM